MPLVVEIRIVDVDRVQVHGPGGLMDANGAISVSYGAARSERALELFESVVDLSQPQLTLGTSRSSWRAGRTGLCVSMTSMPRPRSESPTPFSLSYRYSTVHLADDALPYTYISNHTSCTRVSSRNYTTQVSLCFPVCRKTDASPLPYPERCDRIITARRGRVCPSG